MRFLLASVAGFLGLAVPAHADLAADDAGFLAALQNAHIEFPSPERAIAAGRAVCGLAEGGKDTLDIVKNLKASNPGIGFDDAFRFVAISASGYCPEDVEPGAD